jgi:hypothetical protein
MTKTTFTELVDVLRAISPDTGDAVAVRYMRNRHERGRIYAAYTHIAQSATAPAGQVRKTRRALVDRLTTAHHDLWTAPETL